MSQILSSCLSGESHVLLRLIKLFTQLPSSYTSILLNKWVRVLLKAEIQEESEPERIVPHAGADQKRWDQTQPCFQRRAPVHLHGSIWSKPWIILSDDAMVVCRADAAGVHLPAAHGVPAQSRLHLHAGAPGPPNAALPLRGPCHCHCSGCRTALTRHRGYHHHQLQSGITIILSKWFSTNR
jgi:hypothetical protein